VKLLVLGGARSGKSSYALDRAQEAGQGRDLVFVATAQAGDQEMAARIAAHQASRGPAWRLIEEPRRLAPILDQASQGQVLLVDCLTVWLANVLAADEKAVEEAQDSLVQAAAACRAGLILVANEVGLGIVPDNALARNFRDLAGRLNQNLARTMEEVVLITAGLPLRLKGKGSG